MATQAGVVAIGPLVDPLYLRFADGPKPVSYTHLDVYKRQIVDWTCFATTSKYHSMKLDGAGTCGHMK